MRSWSGLTNAANRSGRIRLRGWTISGVAVLGVSALREATLHVSAATPPVTEQFLSELRAMRVGCRPYWRPKSDRLPHQKNRLPSQTSILTTVTPKGTAFQQKGGICSARARTKPRPKNFVERFLKILLILNGLVFAADRHSGILANLHYIFLIK